MDTSDIHVSGILKKGEELLNYVEGHYKDNDVRGFLVLTNKRFLFLKKPSLFSKGLDILVSCSLGNIMSVSTGGLLIKLLNLTISKDDKIKVLHFSCQNIELFAQKVVGAKQEFAEEQKIEAKRILIEEGNKDSADDILKKRLARGEIDTEEFHKRIQRT